MNTPRHMVMCVPVWSKVGPLLPGTVIRYCETCKAAVYLPGSHIPRVEQDGWGIICEDCAAANEEVSELVADPEIVDGLSQLYGQQFTAEQLTKHVAKEMAERSASHFRKRRS